MAPTLLSRRRPATGLASFFVLALALMLPGCGDDDDGNPLAGDVPGTYRLALEPIIVAVNEIEMDVQETAVGSSGQATAANLAAAFQRLRPRLTGTLEAFEQIDPPSEWIDMHGQIRKLITLRLAAFDALLAGFESEDQTLYELAEQHLVEANGLIPVLNEQLLELDLDLAAGGEATVAGKPTSFPPDPGLRFVP